VSTKVNLPNDKSVNYVAQYKKEQSMLRSSGLGNIGSMEETDKLVLKRIIAFES
jgi:hypothetical protein